MVGRVQRCSKDFRWCFIATVPFAVSTFAIRLPAGINNADQHWVATWGTALLAPGPPGPTNSGFDNRTLRQIVHTSVGGNQVRVRFSTFGGSALRISAARIALRDEGSAIVAESDRALTFGGPTSITVPARATTANLLSKAPAKDVPTLREFPARFLDGHARANRQKPSGVAAKEMILRVHLMPALGHKRLDAIKSEDVQHLKSRLSTKAAKTVNNILTVLNVLLKKAVDWDVIDPCRARSRCCPCRRRRCRSTISTSTSDSSWRRARLMRLRTSSCSWVRRRAFGVAR